MANREDLGTTVASGLEIPTCTPTSHAAAKSLQSCLTLGPQTTKLFCPLASPGKNTGVGCHAALQGIFPTQGSCPRASVSCISGQAPYYQCRLGSPPCPRTCFTSHHDPPQVFPSNAAGVLNNKVLATHRPQSQMEMRRWKKQEAG